MFRRPGTFELGQVAQHTFGEAVVCDGFLMLVEEVGEQGVVIQPHDLFFSFRYSFIHCNHFFEDS